MPTATTPRPPLTKQQAKILAFMAREFAQTMRMPTIREMCDHMLIASPNGVAGHLRALKKKGYITFSLAKGDHGGGTARNTEIVGLAAKLAPVVREHMKELLAGDE